MLATACESAADKGIGYLLGGEALQLHKDMLTDLAPILQIYVGCAVQLYGGLETIELVKIHIESGKVSFMGYDDFEGRPVPDLIERIKVKLWERQVDFFDYVGDFVPQPLYFKSLYIDDRFEYFQDQTKFDQELMRSKLFDFANDDPTRELFYGALKGAGYRINGYELCKAA
jgi:DNA phosphorothioation-associated putative methyltransferase